jgi:hypothetical protein
MVVSRTINTLFMVPTLRLTLEQLIEHGFIDAYEIDSLRDEQYEDAVYLLFKPANPVRFEMFIESQLVRNGLIDEYDYENGLVVLVYKLDPAYKTDLDLVKSGKYSETSKIFQELFKQRVNIEIEGVPSTEDSFQNMVFNKSPILVEHWRKEANIEIPVDREYWSMYNIDKETLKL